MFASSNANKPFYVEWCKRPQAETAMVMRTVLTARLHFKASGYACTHWWKMLLDGSSHWMLCTFRLTPAGPIAHNMQGIPPIHCFQYHIHCPWLLTAIDWNTSRMIEPWEVSTRWTFTEPYWDMFRISISGRPSVIYNAKNQVVRITINCRIGNINNIFMRRTSSIRKYQTRWISFWCYNCWATWWWRECEGGARIRYRSWRCWGVNTDWGR